LQTQKTRKTEFGCGALAIAAPRGTGQKKMTVNREGSGCRE